MSVMALVLLNRGLSLQIKVTKTSFTANYFALLSSKFSTMVKFLGQEEATAIDQVGSFFVFKYYKLWFCCMVVRQEGCVLVVPFNGIIKKEVGPERFHLSF